MEDKNMENKGMEDKEIQKQDPMEVINARMIINKAKSIGMMFDELPVDMEPELVSQIIMLEFYADEVARMTGGFDY